MTKTLFILALTLLLNACATTSSEPALRYYVLDESLVAADTSSRITKLAIAPITVSAYLEQPNLVLKDGEHEFTVANYHLWADPLDSSIRRAVSTDLMLLRNDLLVMNECASCKQLKIWVNHFYPSADGQISLSGSFSIESSALSDSAAAAQINQRFSFVGTQQRDGYTGSVIEMRSLIKNLSAQIASTLERP